MQNIDGRKISLVVIFLLILVVIALFIGKFTYSYLAPDIDDDKEQQGVITANGDTLIFSKGKVISLNATTDNFNSDSGNITSSTSPTVKLVASEKTKNASATYFAGVNIYKNSFVSSDGNAEVILTVRDETGTVLQSSSDTLNYVTVNGVSGFDITGKTGAFNISSDHLITTTSSTNGTTHTWTFTLTFVNKTTDQSINEDASLDMEVTLQKDRISLGNLGYKCAGKEMGSCFAEYYSLDSSIYYHDASLANGAGDNSYRYAGSSDTTNNFVCFGSDASTCPTDNLYRIIGIFDNQVKLIKYDYATKDMLGTDGGYYTSFDNSGNPATKYKGSNSLSNIGSYCWSSDLSVKWSSAPLDIVNLNTNFLNNINSNWASKIASTVWKTAGNSQRNINLNPASVAYQNEIVNPMSTDVTTEKIGLVYVSDYGFAAAPSAWTTVLYDSTNSGNDYRLDSITSVNWMYMGLYEWTITPASIAQFQIFIIGNSGSVNAPTIVSHMAFVVRPVFYLNTDVKLLSGTGTMSDPYIIG